MKNIYHDDGGAYCLDLGHGCHNDAEYHEGITATLEHTQSEADELADVIDQFSDYTPYDVELM